MTPGPGGDKNPPPARKRKVVEPGSSSVVAPLIHLIRKGPTPDTCTIASSGVAANMVVPAGAKAYPPAGSARNAALSYCGPMPNQNVPRRTVMFSSTGCECGGTIVPGGS